MRLTNNLCLSHPNFGGIKNEPLRAFLNQTKTSPRWTDFRYSKFLLDLLRGVNSWLVLCMVYGCTVVQDQCIVTTVVYVTPKTIRRFCMRALGNFREG
jgi:hypothetical protein